MSWPSSQVPEQVLDCPKCGSPMVRRTAKRGPNAGNEFWGCSEFPKCRSVRQAQPRSKARDPHGKAKADEKAPADAKTKDTAARTHPAAVDTDGGIVNVDSAAAGTDSATVDIDDMTARTGHTAASAEQAELNADWGDRIDSPRRLLGKITRGVIQAADKGWRWYLESDEPDANGRWDSGHRKKVLAYIYERDGRRCGLCAGEMKKKGAQIEHVVPKVFAVFSVRRGGRAEPGTRYKSRLHKLDNLQASHSYCNKRKGNTPKVSKWRHPAMPQLTVADTGDGVTFVLPWKPPSKPNKTLDD